MKRLLLSLLTIVTLSTSGIAQSTCVDVTGNFVESPNKHQFTLLGWKASAHMPTLDGTRLIDIEVDPQMGPVLRTDDKGTTRYFVMETSGKGKKNSRQEVITFTEPLVIAIRGHRLPDFVIYPDPAPGPARLPLPKELYRFKFTGKWQSSDAEFDIQSEDQYQRWSEETVADHWLELRVPAKGKLLGDELQIIGINEKGEQALCLKVHL